ncbi:unnamed protein product [Zymoseptoria tritici ST99CH_3D1]|nr:unnamed protein product [Zymoseptoria tritici ST99CH_3D1]
MQPSNPLGAFIFWSYIIAALGLSIKTIYTIRKLPNSDSPRRIRHERLHISLALLSFTVLSYNMLHVLFRSFNEWSIPEPPVPLQLSIAFLQRVGLWSWTSSLFFDFGTAIVASPSEYLYTQSALLVTFWLSVDLSVEGLRHHIPDLWSFFALAQILPISFTQNLLYLALLRTPADRTPPDQVTFPRNKISAALLAYFVALRWAPSSGSQILTVVVVARALLLVPWTLAKTSSTSGTNASAPARWSARDVGWLLGLMGAAATALQVFEVRRAGLSVEGLLLSLTSHPAVTTLGADMFISVVSWLCWQCASDGSDVQAARTGKLW